MATTKQNTLIVLCVCFCVIAVLIIAVKGTVNARTHEYTITCETPNDFYAWKFSDNFLIQIPPSASDISAMACPGTSLFNVDFVLSETEFTALAKKNEWSNIITGTNFHVRAFYRYGADSLIKNGYYIPPTNSVLSMTTIGVWYDINSTRVMFRQCGKGQSD